jgi:imidazolonepropionase-like amidohydrolase
MEVVDCAGRVLMPGLIDAHVHVYAAGLNFTRIAQSPFSYLAHFAARFMRASLDRGFTTLRDVGGADVGLASALREGLLDGVSQAILRRPRHQPNRRPWRLPARRSRLRLPSSTPSP